MCIVVSEGDNIDCESEASFEVTRKIEKDSLGKRRDSRRLSTTISETLSKEAATIESNQSEEKNFNPRHDAKLEDKELQSIIDEIDGNLRDTTFDELPTNKKKTESDQGKQKCENKEDTVSGQRSRVGSDVSNADPPTSDNNKK